MAQSEIILESPDGTKECRIKLENDGYLYVRNGKGEAKRVSRIDSNLQEPQYD